jgi:phage portal protein BeeE
MTPFVFRRTVMALQLLRSNAHALIIQYGYRLLVKLRLFKPGDVAVFKHKDELC